MTKVYVVSSGIGTYGSSVQAVFSTELKAEQYLDGEEDADMLTIHELVLDGRG